LHPSTLAKRVSILLFLAIVAFYIYGLGLIPLVGPDEPRYAQVAREMFSRGDLITPTLGGHPWFEKPALLYWMMIASFKMFGVSEWSARLGSALAGLLTIAAVWYVGREVERTSSSFDVEGLGFWSAFAAATSLGMIVFSRGASFDIVITMTTTWALSFFVLQEFAATLRGRTMLLSGFYIAVGLSLLAKGLVGVVIPFGVVGLETAVGLAMERLLNDGVISLERLVELCSTNPARILSLADRGTLRPGARADITILDPEFAWAFDVSRSKSKSRNTPFDGQSFRGAAIATIVGGRVVYLHPDYARVIESGRAGRLVS